MSTNHNTSQSLLTGTSVVTPEIIEAASLEALTPPSTLAPVQAAAVTAIQSVQTALTKTADALNKRVVTSANPAKRSARPQKRRS